MDISGRPSHFQTVRMSWGQVEDRVKTLTLEELKSNPHYYLPNAEYPSAVIAGALVAAESRQEQRNQQVAGDAKLTYRGGNRDGKGGGRVLITWRYSRDETVHNRVKSYIATLRPDRTLLQNAKTVTDLLAALDAAWTDQEQFLREEIIRLEEEVQDERRQLEYFRRYPNAEKGTEVAQLLEEGEL